MVSDPSAGLPSMGKILPACASSLIFVIRSLLSVVISYLRQKLIKDINDSLSERIFKKYLNKNFLFFIDSNSFVVTNSVVMNSFQENSYISGQPAKMIKNRFKIQL